MEIALLLGVDPKHADQMVRGTVVLPHGTGATKKVLVIATGEKLKEAEGAGADHMIEWRPNARPRRSENRARSAGPAGLSGS